LNDLLGAIGTNFDFSLVVSFSGSRNTHDVAAWRY